MSNLNQSLKLILVAGAVAGMTACSSNPSSPWGQGGSPWESRSEEVVEPVVAEPVAEEPAVIEADQASPAVEEEPVTEVDLGAPGTPMEDPTANDEPAAEEVVVEEEPVHEEHSDESMQSGDIASLPAGQFAVQVVASSSMENLLAFAKANGIGDDWTAKTQVGDKVWYILLAGVYATKAEAEQALEEMSQRLDTAPWIRNLGSIQEVMVP